MLVQRARNARVRVVEGVWRWANPAARVVTNGRIVVRGPEAVLCYVDASDSLWNMYQHRLLPPPDFRPTGICNGSRHLLYITPQMAGIRVDGRGGTLDRVHGRVEIQQEEREGGGPWLGSALYLCDSQQSRWCLYLCRLPPRNRISKFQN